MPPRAALSPARGIRFQYLGCANERRNWLWRPGAARVAPLVVPQTEGLEGEKSLRRFESRPGLRVHRWQPGLAVTVEASLV